MPAASREMQCLGDILEQYRERRGLYERYCVAIANMLSSLLEDRGYKYHIQWRVKDPDSLLRKVRRKRDAGRRCRALADVDDVAGVRVILYLDCDRRKFTRDLRREFSGKIRIKHKKKLSGYEATHFIVTLGEKRLALSEYRRFAGMACEIQVTSILNHAWAEIEHDIFYKPFFEAGDRSRSFRAERRKIKAILERHIKAANVAFSEIIRAFRRRAGAATPGAGPGVAPAAGETPAAQVARSVAGRQSPKRRRAAG